MTINTINVNPRQQVLVLYIAGCYLIDLFVCAKFSSWVAATELFSQTFLSLVVLTYPLIYLLPLILLTLLVNLNPVRNSRWPGRLIEGAIILASILTTIFLYADLRLHDLYDFHVNGFVLNLLFTPGGIESMGGGPDTFIAAGVMVFVIVAFHLSLYLCARYMAQRLPNSMPRNRHLVFPVALVFLTLTLLERTAYGLSDIRQFAPILNAAETLPLYNRVTFRSLGKALHIPTVERSNIRLNNVSRDLNYPGEIIQFKDDQFADDGQSPNIVWLVSESMRWDMLSPEIMPNTWQRSTSGIRFTNHYSGGNGTRQGLFSLFYGIYGSYWDAFLLARQSPLLMDIVQSQNYQLGIYTSADFTYPEFDQTLFARIPAENLHQKSNDMSAHDRDIENTAEIVSFLRNRDKNRPFMVFMFYESTHARYDFPPDKPLREPYLADLNYATMTRESLGSRIGELKNRYINASHFIDQRMEEVFATLSDEGLWDNTIVMATGDHGEEFMENGFWGHNSGFSEQQIRTPMVLWLPGQAPGVREDITSHMDIVPTLLPLLGVTNQVSDFSLGTNLASDDRNSFVVVSDWAGVCYLGHGYKFTMPFSSSLELSNKLYDNTDEPISDPVPFLSAHRADVTAVLENANKYTR